ncbi:hypothetical protein GOP47_0000755 [Adiantum capillus-veneris]|uniref:Uncharacterized protein n=1 Tax=Adiantum capillus-veneris TaxID=13818 RepID=A0A9D4VDK7_ADICA|nr:hypothetical protein GOP47_0000755 [Adiantum capillus-veneris]
MDYGRSPCRPNVVFCLICSQISVTKLKTSSRSSPGLNAAQFLDGSLHSALWSSDALAKNLGFQRRQLEKYVPRKQKRTRAFFIKADATTSGSGRHVSPLEPESPTGQFLIELLHSHPHLLAAAAEQQLDKLAEDRLTAEAQEHSGSNSSDLILYKRIAELKSQERRTTVEEILKESFNLYTRVRHWRCKFHMGQVYATSALYGYFLRRVDEKFQMEKILSPSAPESDRRKRQASDAKFQDDKRDTFATEMLATLSAILGFGNLENLEQDVGFSSSGRSKNLLRNYLLSFEADTLYRCATVRSIESACIIERHTAALFGEPDSFDVSEVTGREVAMMLSLAGLRRLVLEAVAFGSFLWDAETLVDSHYTIVAPD